MYHGWLAKQTTSLPDKKTQDLTCVYVTGKPTEHLSQFFSFLLFIVNINTLSTEKENFTMDIAA